jgi:hypothetical protein
MATPKRIWPTNQSAALAEPASNDARYDEHTKRHEGEPTEMVNRLQFLSASNGFTVDGVSWRFR